MDRLKELEILIRGLLDKAKAETRSLTPEEVTQFEAAEAEIRSIRQTQDLEARAAGIAADLSTTLGGDTSLRNHAAPPAQAATPGPAHDFRNMGELVLEITRNPNSDRLRALRAMALGDSASGGVFVPTEFANALFSVSSRPGIMAAGATIVPPGASPDGKTRWPKLRQSVNVFGGVVVYWVDEAASITASDAKVDYFELLPKKMVALVKSSSEALANIDSMNTFITGQMAAAINAAEDVAFLTGNGVGKPMGITESPCKLSVTRAGAGAIAFADVANMYGKLLVEPGDKPIWITCRQNIPGLLKLTDTAGAPIWMVSPRDGAPNVLYGYPVEESDRTPLLGSAGDLMLVNRKMYHIKRGTMTVSVSEHAYFTTDEVGFRLTWHVDGQMPLDTYFTAENGATYSPIVSLN